MITLQLSVEEVNGILFALSKLPYEQVAVLVPKIQSQAAPQVKKEEPKKEE